MDDLISRQEVIKKLDEALELITKNVSKESDAYHIVHGTVDITRRMIMTIQPEIVRCKDCKWWRQQTNYQGAPLSFGFCESDDMWRSLYGETNEVAHIDTDDDFYCGYAERRTDEA